MINGRKVVLWDKDWFEWKPKNYNRYQWNILAG